MEDGRFFMHLFVNVYVILCNCIDLLRIFHTFADNKPT